MFEKIKSIKEKLTLKNEEVSTEINQEVDFENSDSIGMECMPFWESEFF